MFAQGFGWINFTRDLYTLCLIKEFMLQKRYKCFQSFETSKTFVVVEL